MRTSQATRRLVAGLATASVVSAPNYAVADEGGISVYLPGFYGSFAAAPTEPGWAMSAVYYHTSVDAGANQAFPRGGRGEVDLGIEGRSDAVFFVPHIHSRNRYWATRRRRSACSFRSSIAGHRSMPL